MPYKRYNKKKTTKKGKPYKAKALAKTVKKIVSKAKPKREERFIVSRSMDTSATANAFSCTTISNISQGDQFNQRDGRKIYVSGVRLNIAMQNNSAVKAKFMRIMVVRDKNAQGQTLNTTSFANLLRDENFVDVAPTQAGSDIVQPLSTTLLQIYYDKVFRLPVEYEGNVHLNRFVPIKRTFLYDSLGSTNVPTTGEVYVILHLCDADGVTTTAVVSVNCMFRVHYKDA